MQALVKLSGPNRKVWFISEDGETISYIRDNQQLYKLAGYGGKKEETTDIAINLANESINNLPDNLKSIALDSSKDFSCCALHFTTGEIPPTFSVPYGWLAVGDDVVDSAFIPAANSDYDIAIDIEGDKITLYVAAYRCIDKVADIKNRVLNGDASTWDDEDDL